MKVYERKSFPRMARDLKTMYDDGRLSFNNAVQRSFIWKNTTKDNRMSMLIDSMLRGLPVPPMYCNCFFNDPSHKVYDFLDGKQRTLTVIKFLNDEFELVGIPTFETEDGKESDLNGYKYSELPEEMRDIVKTYSFTVYYYENMSQDDAEEMFRRLNNGKSLTTIELTRAHAKSRKKIMEMAKHELFKIALSERAIMCYGNEDIVLKSWIVLYNQNKSLETKSIRPVMREALITTEQMEDMGKCFDMVISVYNSLMQEEKTNKKVIRKLLTKTHLISLMPVVKHAIAHNTTIECLQGWVIHFFDTDNKECTVSDVYNRNIITGSAQESAVRARIDAVFQNFTNYLDSQSKYTIEQV